MPQVRTRLGSKRHPSSALCTCFALSCLLSSLGAKPGLTWDSKRCSAAWGGGTSRLHGPAVLGESAWGGGTRELGLGLSRVRMHLGSRRRRCCLCAIMCRCQAGAGPRPFQRPAWGVSCRWGHWQEPAELCLALSLVTGLAASAPGSVLTRGGGTVISHLRGPGPITPGCEQDGEPSSRSGHVLGAALTRLYHRVTGSWRVQRECVGSRSVGGVQ